MGTLSTKGLDMKHSGWKQIFVEWPHEMPQRGVLVTTFQEQIPFSGFLTGEELLFVERQTPDVTGGRAVILPYENVAAVKLVDVVKPKALRTMGFEGTLVEK
jgi:hypothetical protein